MRKKRRLLGPTSEDPLQGGWKGSILHLEWTEWEEGQLSTGILRVENGCVTYVAASRQKKICPQDYLNQQLWKEGGVTFLGLTDIQDHYLKDLRVVLVGFPLLPGNRGIVSTPGAALGLWKTQGWGVGVTCRVTSWGSQCGRRCCRRLRAPSRQRCSSWSWTVTSSLGTSGEPGGTWM